MNRNIIDLHSKITRSAVFRLDGDRIDVAAELQALAEAVHSDTDSIEWDHGSESGASLGDLIVGAYWAMTECHGGQASPEYASLCALGRVFSPGRSATGPCPDSAEYDAYHDICEYLIPGSMTPDDALRDAAQAVVDAWEGGDLAAAVRHLAEVLKS